MPKATDSNIRDYATALAYLQGARSREDGRPVQNNTRVVDCTVTVTDGDTSETLDAVGILLHQTIVVAYLPDSREVINSGGWHSNTTADRIRGYSSVSIVSQHSYDLETGKKTSDYTRWTVGSDVVGVTPARVQKCRTCKGVGQTKAESLGEYVDDPTNRTGWPYRFQYYDTPKVTWHDCYRCKATGEADYGSKEVYRAFTDGMVVRNGKVVGKVTRIDSYTVRQPREPRPYYGTITYTRDNYIPPRELTDDERIDNYRAPRASDFVTYPSATDGTVSVRFSEMDEAAVKEMQEWDAILHGKDKK